MLCANCDNIGKIKYQYLYDTDNEPTVFCDECFDLFIKLNRKGN